MVAWSYFMVLLWALASSFLFVFVFLFLILKSGITIPNISNLSVSFQKKFYSTFHPSLTIIWKTTLETFFPIKMIFYVITVSDCDRNFEILFIELMVKNYVLFIFFKFIIYWSSNFNVTWKGIPITQNSTNLKKELNQFSSF